MSLYNNPFQRRFYRMVLELLLVIIRQGPALDLSEKDQRRITEAWKLIDEL